MRDAYTGQYPTASLYAVPGDSAKSGGLNKYADKLVFANASKGEPVTVPDAEISAGITKLHRLEERPLQPGMVYDHRTIGYDFPIWAKIPNTEHVLDSVPRVAAFGMRHPPPMTYLRTSPVPGAPPTGTFSAASLEPINTWVNQYGLFHVTYELEFEAKPIHLTQWNPAVYRNVP